MIDDPPVCQIDLSGTVWTELADDPRARALPGLSEPLVCEILRRTPRRRVMRTIAGPALLVKQYFNRGALQRLKTFARGAPAELEWRALRRAAQRGLSVPKPLALGFQRGASLLVTDFIESAVSLDEFLRGLNGVGQKRQVLRAAALLLRAMHDAGFFQRDLHLGNLIGRESGGAIELWLLDLQRVDVDPWRRRAKRWRDLAALHGGAFGSAAERLRFLKTYLSAAPALCRDERGLVARLDRAGRRHRFRLWRSRQKRCCGENWEFRPVRAGSLSGFARRDVWSSALEAALSTAQRLPTGAAIVKDSQTTTVARAVVEEQKVFIKRYNFQGIGYAFKDLFRSARAKRGWLAANNCAMRGIDVALPLAYLERRRWCILRESYLVTAAVDGSEISELLARRGTDVLFKRELIGQLARWLKRLHERGVAPRDLKGENMIATQAGAGVLRLSIVDFDGMACGPMSWSARRKNLARLARALGASVSLTATDRLRLVNHYLGPGKLSRRRRLYRSVTRSLASA